MKRLPIFATFLLLVGGLSLSAVSAPKKTTHSVSIEDMSFSPGSIEVKVGDTVEWTNNDERNHNVTAKDGSFKSENLGSGDTYRYIFKKAGKFPYTCTLHPRMKATVVVGD